MGSNKHHRRRQKALVAAREHQRQREEDDRRPHENDLTTDLPESTNSPDVVVDTPTQPPQSPGVNENGPSDSASFTREDNTLSATPDASGTTTPPPLMMMMMTHGDAIKTMERLFVAMLAAGTSPLRALGPARTEHQNVDQLQQLLEEATTGMTLTENERIAIRVVGVGGEDAGDDSRLLSMQVLFDLASSATFRVEMLEFQIRAGILDWANSKSRLGVDIQKAVLKLTGQWCDCAEVSSSQFETMLEEKLAIRAGGLLARIIFARIVKLPFNRFLPKILHAERVAFITALEAFAIERPLSSDTVEGQLRFLLAQHVDLRTSFQTLDVDASGTLSTEEFVAFLRGAGMPYPPDVLTAFVKRFDTDGDGLLSYEEFVEFVTPRQFGFNVLTPFGMFYQAAQRHDAMEDVVAKIKTRIFWMQHNDLFSASTRTSRPNHERGGEPKASLKLRVTERFILTRHFGTVVLSFQPTDKVSQVVKNGELVVLILDPEPGSSKTQAALPSQDGGQKPLSAFEYRLRPQRKRTLPKLLWETM